MLYLSYKSKKYFVEKWRTKVISMFSTEVEDYVLLIFSTEVEDKSSFNI